MLYKLLSVAALALLAVETSAVTLETGSLAMHEDAHEDAQEEAAADADGGE